MIVGPNAVAHAADVRESADLLQLELAAIWNECDHESDRQVVACGHLLARAETEHWQRLLASAKRTGADAAYYRERLNRYTAAGDRAPIGNLVATAKTWRPAQ